MEMLNEAIGLGMKSSCVNVGNVEEGGKFAPKRGGKLRFVVRGDGVRKVEMDNPGGAEGISTSLGGSGRKKNSLSQADGSVNNCENLGVALREWKQTDKVNVDV